MNGYMVLAESYKKLMNEGKVEKEANQTPYRAWWSGRKALWYCY